MAFPSSLHSADISSTSAHLSEMNPAAGGHVQGQNVIENEIAAIETKLGIDGSAVTTTVDYKLSGIPASDKAASKTGTETLTNKTLTSPTLNTPTINNPTVVVSALGTNAGITGSIKIAETVLSVATVGVTFSSIPQVYRHLKVIWMARMNTGAELGSGLRFNSDTGANYYKETLEGVSSTASAAEGLAATSADYGSLAGATSGTSMFNMGVIEIPFYSQTNSHKMILSRSFRRNSTSTGNMHVEVRFNAWNNTAAITSITLSESSFTTAFAPGTIFTLYGEP